MTLKHIDKNKLTETERRGVIAMLDNKISAGIIGRTTYYIKFLDDNLIEIITIKKETATIGAEPTNKTYIHVYKYLDN